MIISATQKSLFALLFVFCSYALHAQHISCTDAHILKDKSTLNIPSVSDYTLPNDGLIGCFADTLHQAYWFKFTALTSGTFKFSASATNLAADYDFVLFSEACPCDATASKVVACNWIGAVIAPPYVPTGISNNPDLDFGIADPMAQLEFESTVSLQAGKNYYLVLDNITNNGVGFSISFGGTADIGAPVITPISTLGNLVGKTDVCSGTSNIFEVQTDPQFTDYVWDVPAGAKVIGAGSKVLVNFGNTGGKVKVTAKGSCFVDSKTIDVKVNAAPDLSLNIAPYFCKNSCLSTSDIKYTEKNNLSNIDYQFYNKADDAYNGTLKNLSPPNICQAQKIWLRGTSLNGCFDTLTIKIEEKENPSVVLIGGGVVCYGDTVELNFSFTGKPPYITTYSDGIQDWSFTTNSPIATQKIVINQPTKIVIKDFKESSNLCQTRIIGDADFFPSINCKCLKKAGTMNSIPIDACADQLLTAIHNKDDVKDITDKLVFILHNVQTPELATIFATNDKPEFSFISGLMYEVPYYVAAVVAKKKTNGDIDLTDPCIGISLGTPIMFHRPPSAVLSGDSLICNNDITDITLTPIGKAPFEVTYGNSTINNTLNINNKTTFKEGIGVFYVKTIKDAMGCVANNADTINIKSPKSFGTQSKIYVCNANNTAYQIVLDIDGGDVSSYLVSGIKGSFNKDVFTSIDIPNGQSVTFKITDKKGCDTLFVTDKHVCNCGASSQPATINPLPIVVCENLSATASYAQDEVLVSGEVQGYVLHDGTTTALGKVWAYNTTPQFAKISGMSNGVSYLITSVAGPKDGNGKVDLQSPCTKIGKSTTISFVEEPTVAIAGETEICGGQQAAISLNFTGKPLFDVVYYDGVKNVSILNISTLQHQIMLPTPTTTTYKLVSVKTTGMPGCQGKVQSGKDELLVSVLPILEVKNVQVNCSSDKTQFDVSFDINGGKSTAYEVNAAPVAGSFFKSTLFKDGDVYNFTITGGTGCKPVTISGTGYCTCPPNASLAITLESPIKCHNDKNAILSTVVKNVKAPYTFAWNNGAITEKISDISAGTYTVTVSNTDNCRLVSTFEIKNPEELRAFVEVEDAVCYNEANGQITFVSTEGGTSPYSYSIDKQNFTPKNIFPTLKSGRYELMVKDANNCVWQAEKMIDQPEEFTVSLGEDKEIELGQSTQIQAIVNGTFEKITWSDSVLKDLTETITPLKSQEYKISVFNKSGCEAKDAVLILVKADREVFAPTNFSPNGDGHNDAFTIFGGIDAKKIKELKIFDRWGNEIYAVENVNLNDETVGWQGTFRGQIANQDNYIYQAIIEFIDGKEKSFKGEVLLMR